VIGFWLGQVRMKQMMSSARCTRLTKISSGKHAVQEGSEGWGFANVCGAKSIA